MKDQCPTRPWVFPVVLLLVAAGPMLLGPSLHALLAASGHSVPFHRVMDRSILICALVGIVLFARHRLLPPWHREAASARQWLLGLALALVSAQAMIGLQLAFGGFVAAPLTASQIAGRLALALVAAFFVPILEETLFRGFLQTEAIAAWGHRAGWLAAALVYAAAHFLKVPTSFDHQPVHAGSGVEAMLAAFYGLGEGTFLGGRGLNLLLVGVILGATYLRTGTLWFNAGLHGGWIFVLLLFTGLTRSIEPPHLTWVGGDLLASPATTVVLLFLSLWLWRYFLPPSPGPATGEPAPST